MLNVDSLITSFYSYCSYSDDALMEVISDASTRKSDNSLADTEDFTSSCPCIDNLGLNAERFLAQSCPTVTTPLLTNTVAT